MTTILGLLAFVAGMIAIAFAAAAAIIPTYGVSTSRSIIPYLIIALAGIVLLSIAAWAL